MTLSVLQDNIAEGLKETEIKNSYNSCQFQKLPAENSDLSYIGLLDLNYCSEAEFEQLYQNANTGDKQKDYSGLHI